jgi:hypothetical protein
MKLYERGRELLLFMGLLDEGSEHQGNDEALSILLHVTELQQYELADLFGVHTRQLRFWLAGGAMAAYYVRRLERLEATVGELGRGQESVAVALFRTDETGVSTYSSLLAELGMGTTSTA